MRVFAPANLLIGGVSGERRRPEKHWKSDSPLFLTPVIWVSGWLSLWGYLRALLGDTVTSLRVLVEVLFSTLTTNSSGILRVTSAIMQTVGNLWLERGLSLAIRSRVALRLFSHSVTLEGNPRGECAVYFVEAGGSRLDQPSLWSW